MMDAQGLAGAMGAVAGKIEENKEYLTRLDQLNGDGDLGISMSEGFKAVDMLLESLSFGLTGMAKALKGTREAGGEQIAVALRAGVDKIMEKAGSKPGERTILDSLCPAVEAYAGALGMETCPLEAGAQTGPPGGGAPKPN